MQSAFGAGFLWGTPVGGAPVMFASLQSCSLDASFDQKILYGQKSFAQEMARGKGKLDFKATVGRIDPVLFNAIFWGGATATGQISTALGESTTLAAPGGATTIAVIAANASSFRTDLGVFDPAVGRFMTQAAQGTAPGGDQYTVNPATGGYTFAAADAGKTVKLYYTYGLASGTTVSVTNPLMDCGPVFRADLVQTFRGKQSVLTAWACQSFKLSFPFKQDDFTLPEFDFSAMDDGTGSVLSHAMAGY
jgi:hypothetical protein